MSVDPIALVPLTFGFRHEEAALRAGVVWTAALDERVRTLRRAGLTWDALALDMGLGRNTVLERGRRLGAQKLPRQRIVPPAEALDRPPRPPGHPECWGLITAGTVLDGAPYPYPVYL